MLWIVLLIIIVVVLILLFYLIGTYNMFVRLRNTIDKTWSDIDVKLKQRADELPKLINTVKGYMKHERETLESVTKARTAYLNANTIQEKAAADNMISGALKSLFAVAENYPNLKANENFMQLQGRISGLESDLAQKREIYNSTANTYNIKTETFPSNIIAGMWHFVKRELFKATEQDRQDVKVEF